MQKCRGGMCTRVQHDWRRGAQDEVRVLDRVGDKAGGTGVGGGCEGPCWEQVFHNLHEEILLIFKIHLWDVMSSSFSFLGRHIKLAKQASWPLMRHCRQVHGEHCVPGHRTLALSMARLEFRPTWACQAQRRCP